MKSVEVEIYGRKYKLRGEDPEKIIKIAQFLNQQLDDLNEKYDFIDQNRLLVLQTINMAEELYDLQEQNHTLKEDIDRLNKLISTFMSDNEF